MNSRDRILTALNHKEADYIPFDLGGMAQSGIHRTAYINLRRFLKLPEKESRLLNIITQVARQDKDFNERLKIDTQIVYGRWANNKEVTLRDKEDYHTYTDEWGIGRRMPKVGGYYYDMYAHPLDMNNVNEGLKTYIWPDPTDPKRFTGLEEEVKCARKNEKLVVLMGLCPGIVEMYSWLRGFENFYIDLASKPKIVEYFLDKMVELKAAYWKYILSKFGQYIDVVNEADDMAGQNSMLFSPEIYRKLIKPYHRALFSTIKKAAPQVKVLFHSCGAIRPIIPDLIEIGVDILNPIQIGAKGIDPIELKKDFGKDLSFWGGGVDAQNVLEKGKPQEIRNHVRRNIEALASGGGYVFSADHIIQPNVLPENIMIVWDTFQKYKKY